MIFANTFLDGANQELNRNVQGFSDEVGTVFLTYNWPGNVRELKNIGKKSYFTY